jgi:hypothetical protein
MKNFFNKYDFNTKLIENQSNAKINENIKEIKNRIEKNNDT